MYNQIPRSRLLLLTKFTELSGEYLIINHKFCGLMVEAGFARVTYFLLQADI